MKNLKNKLKFMAVLVVISLGFLFCFNMVSVNAEDVETTTTEQVNIIGIYEYNAEGQGNAKFTLYSDNTFVTSAHDLETDETREGKGTYIFDGNILILNVNNQVLKFKINGNALEPYEEPEATQPIDSNSFLSHLKDLKWDEAETIFGWVIAYLLANFGTIVGLVITIILKKLNETKNSKVFQEALAKMSVEAQNNTAKTLENINDNLKNISTENKAFIEEQKAKLEALQSDSTRTIANELSKVTDMLHK